MTTAAFAQVDENTDLDKESRLTDRSTYLFESSGASGLYQSETTAEQYRNKLGYAPQRLENVEISRLNKTTNASGNEFSKSSGVKLKKNNLLAQLLINPFTIIFSLLIIILSCFITLIVRTNKKLNLDRIADKSGALLPADMVIYEAEKQGDDRTNKSGY